MSATRLICLLLILCLLQGLAQDVAAVRLDKRQPAHARTNFFKTLKQQPTQTSPLKGKPVASAVDPQVRLSLATPAKAVAVRESIAATVTTAEAAAPVADTVPNVWTKDAAEVAAEDAAAQQLAAQTDQVTGEPPADSAAGDASDGGAQEPADPNSQASAADADSGGQPAAEPSGDPSGADAGAPAEAGADTAAGAEEATAGGSETPPIPAIDASHATSTDEGSAEMAERTRNMRKTHDALRARVESLEKRLEGLHTDLSDVRDVQAAVPGSVPKYYGSDLRKRYPLTPELVEPESRETNPANEPLYRSVSLEDGLRTEEPVLEEAELVVSLAGYRNADSRQAVEKACADVNCSQ